LQTSWANEGCARGIKKMLMTAAMTSKPKMIARFDMIPSSKSDARM
jgi:hypothetical protein